MSKKPAATYLQCLKLLLRPVVRFSLSKSLTVQTFIELSKSLFIEVAAAQLEKNGEKVNVSRLSVATGVHRRDVMRIYREDRVAAPRESFASRVIGQWEQDPRFLTKSKKPKILSIEGEESEFRELVRLVSSDVNPGTVLFELERLGAIERNSRGVKLVRVSHTIKGNPIQSFELLSADEEDLLFAVEENVFSDSRTKNLHARTEYDNVSPKDLPSIRKWFLKEGAEFHLKARNFLAKFDLDINPDDSKVGGSRIVVGTFSRTIEDE